MLNELDLRLKLHNKKMEYRSNELKNKINRMSIIMTVGIFIFTVLFFI